MRNKAGGDTAEADTYIPAGQWNMESCSMALPEEFPRNPFPTYQCWAGRPCKSMGKVNSRETLPWCKSMKDGGETPYAKKADPNNNLKKAYDIPLNAKKCLYYCRKHLSFIAEKEIKKIISLENTRIWLANGLESVLMSHALPKHEQTRVHIFHTCVRRSRRPEKEKCKPQHIHG